MTMVKAMHRGARGFSLVELLLAFALGMSFCALMVQMLMADGQQTQRLSRALRERQLAQRALALLRRDLQRATAVVTTAGIAAGEPPACNLAGRTVLLHLQSEQGPITYSLGPPAEPIWRGQVLMRCGPAFGLDGNPSPGQALNRVVLDGLADDGAKATPAGAGALRLQLRQQLPMTGQADQQLLHAQLLPLPSPNRAAPVIFQAEF